jgi:biotin carboxylase
VSQSIKRVLIFSTTTGYQLRSFGEAARELGIDLMFATDRCHALDDPWRDAAVAVRFHEEDAAVAAVEVAAEHRPVDGVIAVGDRPVVLAARAAAALGVPWHSADAARASAHKRLARARFAAAALPTPGYFASSVDADPRTFAGDVRYPAVIKPVMLSGSRGVIRVNTPDELIAAFQRVATLLARPEIRAQRTGAEDEILVEDFIPGREFAVEGLMSGGAFHCLAIFDKPDPLDGPFFEETIYVTPSRAPDAVQRAVVDAIARAASALSLSTGPIHAECRAVLPTDGGEPHEPPLVYVLEVAARPIGGLCSRVLRFESGNERVSLEHALLSHAVRRDADASRPRRERLAAAVMMIPIPRRGMLRSVIGEDAAREVPHVEDVRITAKMDQMLEPLPEAGSYLGFVFARAPLASQAEKAVREAHRRLVFRVDTAIDVRAG